MSATELSPQGTGAKLAPIHNDEGSKKARMTSLARSSADFYGAIGWVLGLFLTLFVSAPVIWFVTTNASRSDRAAILAWGITMMVLGIAVDIFIFGPIERRVSGWKSKPVDTGMVKTVG